MSKYDEIEGYYDDETKGEIRSILALMLFLVAVIIISFATYFTVSWQNKTDHIYRCNERYHEMKKNQLDLKLKADFAKNCNDPDY